MYLLTTIMGDFNSKDGVWYSDAVSSVFSSGKLTEYWYIAAEHSNKIKWRNP